MLLGWSVYLALHNLVLGFGTFALHTSRWIAAWSALSALYLCARLVHVTAEDVDTAAWALRAQVVAAVLLAPILLSVIAAFSGERDRRSVLGFAVASAGVVVLVLATELYVTSAGQLFVDRLGLRYPWVEVGPAFSSLGVLGLAALGVALRTLRRASELTARQIRWLSAVLIAYVALGVWDAVLGVLDLRILPLFQFAVVLVGAAFDGFSVVSLRALSRDLQRGVAERTTELHRANASLSDALSAAKRANEARRIFLGKMSHELRTPLNAIEGLSDVLSRTQLSMDQRRLVAEVQSASQALLGDVTNVLEFVRIESMATLPSNTEVVEVRPFISQITEELYAGAQSNGLSLHTTFDDAVPDKLELDPIRLRQVLTVVIENALTFTRTGGVSIACSASPGALRLEVKDTGPGMSREALTTIFEPFAGVSDVLDPSAGPGLGLALVHAVLTRLGGAIQVSSKLGAGTTVTLIVPASFPNQEEQGARISLIVGPVRSMRASHADVEPMAGLRVLVAEDVQVNRLVLQMMLKELGVASVVVENGMEAVDLLERGEVFDAILMDCRMPIMDGLEATRRIRAREAVEHLSATPIVAVTAYSLAEDHAAALGSGMNAVLSKPLTLAALRRALARVLPSVATGERSTPAPPSPRGERSSKPVLDVKQLEALRATGRADLAFFESLLFAFDVATTEQLSKLRSALRSATVADVMKAAHTLKGCAASFGAKRLSAQAAALETATRNEGLPGLEIADVLEQEARAASTGAREWISVRYSRSTAPPA
ncbi:MAG: response regulator [Polyangiaceae bacterium]|nr:response regulator [Polyangiaceae bacterium]